MEYIKKILSSLKEVIIYYILSYLFIIIISAIYLVNGKDLNSFLIRCGFYLLNIFNLIFIIIIIKKYNVKYKRMLNPTKFLYFGISISAFLNMFILLINRTVEINDIPLLLNVLSSAIVGPIVEELLFREILYNKLLKFNNKKTSIILTSLIFAMLHRGIITKIYTFIVGIILNLVYDKYKNIYSSIFIHMGLNLIVIFLFRFNIYILILSFINVLLSSLILLRDK